MEKYKNSKYDKYICDLYLNGHYNKCKFRKNYFLHRYPNISGYLKNRFDDLPDDYLLREVIYRIHHGIEKSQVCPVCGKKTGFYGFTTGYREFCSRECRLSEKGISLYKEKLKNTCLGRYGVENVFQTEEVKEKIKKTNLKRYGCEYSSQSEISKLHTRETNMKRYGVPVSSQNVEVKEKMIRTNMKRYGVPYTTMWDVQKAKTAKTCLKRYGYSCSLVSPEIREKSHATMRRKGNFTSSKVEEGFAAYLDDAGIRYERQYKSEMYPWRCDFYLTDYDVYIEIQGHWHHGYNNATKRYVRYGDNQEETEELRRLWETRIEEGNTNYIDAMEVWSERDVEKRMMAL